ncbi:MAG TPA: hypothetical protein GX699_09910 [Firmicutes bacterium]|jgi:cell division transport system permease protein|nr:hypothetical protein [Bacillota bacterium]
MKLLLQNLGYFFQEARIIFRMNLLSYLTSLFSMALIFSLLAMVVAGWWVGSHVIAAIEDEAEISAYYAEDMSPDAVLRLAGEIEKTDGVKEVVLVTAENAYKRMEEILGKEARVLSYFDDNPFSPFIEIKIDLAGMEQVLQEIQAVEGIEYVRDNREVLDRLRQLAGAVRFLGYLIISAVGISTLVIISHLIRTGIENNREQINTLLLLGAPDSFIAFPFLLTGMLLSVGGGVLAAVLAGYALRYLFVRIGGPLPFIPLPSLGGLVLKLAIFIILLSALLGLAGSLSGLQTAKNKA